MLKLEWQSNRQKAAGLIIFSMDDSCRGILDSLEDDPITIWAKLESTVHEKRAGSPFNVLEDRFSIRKKDESLQSLIHKIDEAMRF
ncbi:hypothetical protein EW146_g7732 [Bondarzewia mesenterica]|uniref:Uncharacterized protein n=1 Tax=Bondarzewia mesenterica TaxID=1095465 RepID=A0A4S4LJZ7_9AGAM|nr:hypothetical protein EW146_g7732 [Bondarzewia mesenterica]